MALESSSEAGRRILIVEDDRSSRESLAAALTDMGMTVAAAEGGEEALDHLEQATVDVVVSDLMMNGIDGVELLRRMTSRFPATAFILVTAFATSDRALEALRIGAYACLPKPIDLGGLEAVIVRACAGQPS